MTTYYVFCETHGKVSENYEKKEDALIKKNAHENSGGNHCMVSIIESYHKNVFGDMLEKRRKSK